MTEVAIVGIGMHEFGRTEGVSGMEQGAVAVRRALADCGSRWEDIQFAYGGSREAGSPDAASRTRNACMRAEVHIPCTIGACRPARRAMSTVLSVCPARRSTPPSLAISGNR